MRKTGHLTMYFYFYKGILLIKMTLLHFTLLCNLNKSFATIRHFQEFSSMGSRKFHPIEVKRQRCLVDLLPRGVIAQKPVKDVEVTHAFF